MLILPLRLLAGTPSRILATLDQCLKMQYLVVFIFKGLALLTEKFMFAGAEFDKMRNGAPTSNQPKRDPFGQNC